MMFVNDGIGRIKALVISLNIFPIVFVSSSSIHMPRSLHLEIPDYQREPPPLSSLKSGLQPLAPNVCSKLSDWGVLSGCDSLDQIEIVEILEHYSSSYSSWRESISNYDSEFYPSRWLIVSSIRCDCSDLLMEMVNAMHLARILNSTVIIEADHSNPRNCDCHENVVSSAIPFMTTGFLEMHDIFLRSEFELDLSRELDCVMSTDCALSLRQWNTMILKNSAEDIIAIAPSFPQVKTFEEYLGIDFLVLIHYVWSGHEFDFLAEFPCLSGDTMVDKSLPHALGGCIRRNALRRQRYAMGPPRASANVAPPEFWFCSPCRVNQSWTWHDNLSFVSSYSHLPTITLHISVKESQKQAADAYQAHFKSRLFDAPHTCGNICEQCTVTKGLFFLARELATCSRSRQGYYEILNSWRWLHGFEINFHDIFERNGPSPLGNRMPVTCSICDDLDQGLLKIWDTAHALRLIYTLNSTFELEVENTLPVELRKINRANQDALGHCIIGVHIRRGDSCIDTVGSSTKRRDCHAVSKYLKIATDYQKVNTECRTLYVSSDDASAVVEIVGLSNGSFTVLAANVNRQKYAVNGSVGREELIERRAFSDQSLNRLEIIKEAIADVYGLSRCDVIIGHLGESVFSQTALLLNFASNGVMPPFATINFPMCYYWRYWEGRSDFLNTSVSALDCL